MCQKNRRKSSQTSWLSNIRLNAMVCAFAERCDIWLFIWRSHQFLPVYSRGSHYPLQNSRSSQTRVQWIVSGGHILLIPVHTTKPFVFFYSDIADEREVEASSLSSQLSLSLSLIQGVVLNHPASKRYLGRKYALEVCDVPDFALYIRAYAPGISECPRFCLICS